MVDEEIELPPHLWAFTDGVSSTFRNVWDASGAGAECVRCKVRVYSFLEMVDHRCELSAKKPSDN